MAIPLTPSLADALQEAKSAAKKEGNEPVAPGKKCCPLPGLPVYAHDFEPPKEEDLRDTFLGFGHGFPILYPDIFWTDVWKARHLWKPVADVRLKGPWKGEKGDEDKIIYTTSARGFALLHSPVAKQKKDVEISIGAPRPKKLRPELDTETSETSETGEAKESAAVPTEQVPKTGAKNAKKPKGSKKKADAPKEEPKKEEPKKADAEKKEEPKKADAEKKEDASGPEQTKIEIVPPEGRREPMVFLRKVCLSVPGKEASEHKILDLREENQLTLDFPELGPETGDIVRLLCVAPHWKFRFQQGKDKKDHEGDPWTTTPAGLSEKLSWSLTEIRAVPKTTLGFIKKYSYKDKSGASHTLYGSGTSDRDGTRTDELADRYLVSLGPSRALVFKAIRDVEGRAESVICYDGEKASFGINQWNKAELWALLAYIADFYPEAFERNFARWGLRLSFSRRMTTWNKGDTYTGVTLYRVPCCGADSRAMMDAKTNAERAALKGKLIPLTYKDSASYAFLWILVTAGKDPDIQKAQSEWTSFRITFAIDKWVERTKKKMSELTVLIAMDEFLKSLGSNESAEGRRAKASKVIGKQVDLPFDDYEPAKKEDDKGKEKDKEPNEDDPKKGRKLLGDPKWIFWREKCKEKPAAGDEDAGGKKTSGKKTSGKKSSGKKGGGKAGKK